MLEPCEGKLSCTVLRGESGSNTADLLDQIKAVLTIPLGQHRDRTSEDFLAIRDQIFEIFHMKREDAIEYYI